MITDILSSLLAVPLGILCAYVVPDATVRNLWRWLCAAEKDKLS